MCNNLNATTTVILNLENHCSIYFFQVNVSFELSFTFNTLLHFQFFQIIGIFFSWLNPWWEMFLRMLSSSKSEETTIYPPNFIYETVNIEISVLQVLLTPSHLAIVLEYASGGELFERICSASRFSEVEVIKLMCLNWTVVFPFEKFIYTNKLFTLKLTKWTIFLYFRQDMSSNS